MRAAILLAAGEGRRFGGAPKPLAIRDGRPLLVHALGIARAAPAARLILVVGRQGDRVARLARAWLPRVMVVRNRHWRNGLPTSLMAGVGALWPIERDAFVFLADMPVVPPRLAAVLLRRSANGCGARPAHRNKLGHPVLLGARGLALAKMGKGGPKHTQCLVAADRRCRFDIDRRRDLLRRIPALRR